MNRADLQQLAQDRAADAKALLDAGRWSGAYYLAGYAVECALKACIAKLTGLHDFPDKRTVLRAYSHDMNQLVITAELEDQLDAALRADARLEANWFTVLKWSEEDRYRQRSEAEARELFGAITDPSDGVLPWIAARW